MDYAVPFCGSARTSLHNQVFLEGVKTALLGPKLASSSGSTAPIALSSNKDRQQKYRSWTVEEREVGLKAFARVYAGWGFSQAFYREKLYETFLGFKTLEDFMVGFWEAWGLSKGDTFSFMVVVEPVPHELTNICLCFQILKTCLPCYTPGSRAIVVSKSRTMETSKLLCKLSPRRPWYCPERLTCIFHRKTLRLKSRT